MSQQQVDMGKVLKMTLDFSKEKQDDISKAIVLGVTLAYMGEHDRDTIDPRLAQALSSAYHLSNAVIAPKYGTESMVDFLLHCK